MNVEHILQSINDDLRHPPSIYSEVCLAIDSAATTQDLVELIHKDPRITKFLLTASNSLLFRTTHQLTSLRQVLTIHSPELIKALILCSSLRPLFSSRTYYEDLWEHSLEVAALCYILASKYELDKPKALVAGVMHDIGKLAVIDYCQNGKHTMNEFDCNCIGRSIIESWGFTDILKEGHFSYTDLIKIVHCYLKGIDSVTSNTSDEIRSYLDRYIEEYCDLVRILS